ncbi:type IV toxin-antitoxin system AbiEi family antitoxin domain-containing protein [Nocardioides sp. cx-173]|uniref:type IV toxin-antitoxin system AbiEi family antitoxin domain-containing protein n=1 Tax=Nocardioides sp. cx-173 TaxID=2898796 RepID=UPI001E478CFC|nr:type IV toxin-antitoxin system AbiEi family antitoxin domain-containing protein [Nocardioides sp. cx-173]MCD4525586.1 hypothetical protein [Nocardioides sp. cx-173]UGB42730.1 hypothetical protein LQ940_04185 [Nocardioides sp. cx-173]
MKELPPDHPRLSRIHLRKELLEQQGLNDRAIARLVRNGTLVKVRRGAYLDAGAWDLLDADSRHAVLARAVVRQAKTDLVISHVSALPDWEAPTWGMPLDVVQVTRPDTKAGRREAGVRQHRGRLLDGDVVERNGVLLSSPERVMVELTTMVGVEPCLVAWNYFLHKRLTTLERVDARYRALSADRGTAMDHWPDTLTTDLLLRLADRRCESVGEVRCLFLLWRQHLPMPVPQYEVRDRTGRVIARVDFAWPEYGVFLEFDGLAKYQRLLREGESAADAVVREKLREQEICELTGWRCIRLIWSDLARPEQVGLRIRRLLFATGRAA